MAIRSGRSANYSGSFGQLTWFALATFVSCTSAFGQTPGLEPIKVPAAIAATPEEMKPYTEPLAHTSFQAGK